MTSLAGIPAAISRFASRPFGRRAPAGRTAVPGTPAPAALQSDAWLPVSVIAGMAAADPGAEHRGDGFDHEEHDDRDDYDDVSFDTDGIGPDFESGQYSSDSASDYQQDHSTDPDPSPSYSPSTYSDGYDSGSSYGGYDPGSSYSGGGYDSAY